MLIPARNHIICIALDVKFSEGLKIHQCKISLQKPFTAADSLKNYDWWFQKESYRPCIEGKSLSSFSIDVDW